MNEIYEPLFTPWKVGNVEIKNRIVMLPMEGTNMIAWEANTKFVKGIEELYRDRKDNNIGLMVFSIKDPQNIYDAVCDTKVGTLVTN